MAAAEAARAERRGLESLAALATWPWLVGALGRCLSLKFYGLGALNPNP